MLLKAEAIQRGFGVNGDAAAAYQDGIRASFDKWTAGTGAQADAPFISDAQKIAYFQQSNVGLSGTNPIRQIAEQLWIDSYLNGFEGWATVLSPIPVRYVYSDNEQNNPNLIQWVNENMGGRMPDHNVKVWLQP